MVTPPAIHFANDRFAAESFADVISAETFADVRQSARSGLLHLVMSVFRFPRGEGTSLDLDATPDCLKRDLGFMDGRDPHCEDHFPL
ncbi:hypothetical protein ACCT14_30795 [Rhizobium brockwellii]|jgi:hypothetical protein|uniref:Uncharacterized protein n=1 Tax=Rhizobium brockwellii TaxID=3019932 RepID=A0ABU3YRA0_9HYPH|nr:MULTISPECIES: hypothetical protein [Rhizobium]KPN25769.1 hypothetical protein KS05_11640 [Rhizobium brockwellii]MDV4181156.1 hypothetical protein [Rhizobium brockwellii]MDV4188369.1 hypothetical protein [Rhizobium brockwellii]QIO53843.1 hypothetical protein HA461_22900 [Rhizobium leguminosarum bv. trifolii]QJX07612.1 hypothetical protein RLCC275e_22620 [Rhizobium brockwellii]